MKYGLGAKKYAILFPGIVLGFLVYIIWFGNTVVAGDTGDKQTARCQIAAVKQNNSITKYNCSARLSYEEAYSYLASQPDITRVAAVQSYKMALVPNDPGYSEQKSYLEKIKAPGVWDKIQSLPLRPVIAVLDTGVDIDNPDLQSNIWFNSWEVPGDKLDNDNNGFVDDQYGWDFVDNTPDPRPKFDSSWNQVAMQHGTVVAGVAAAVGNNKLGVAGVAWNARIMPIRVLDALGTGDTVTVARGIQYAIDNHADIINLSFVGSVSDPILQDAIHRAYLAGILVVAAAGNEQQVGVNMDKQPQYPVCDDGLNGENQVIGVAAVELNDSRSLFSNYGNHCIDLSAPGSDIFSTQFVSNQQPGFTHAYGGYWSGTSVAAPLVSGALALLKSAYPRLSPSQLRDVLIASGDQLDFANPGLSGQMGRRVNLAEAFKLASSNIFAVKSPIVVAPQSQSESEVSVLDVSGERLEKFLAYHPRFNGGLNVASADFDGDGQADIVTVPKSAGGPHVRIFDQKGNVLYQFMAFPDSWRGGLSVAAADFNGKGKADIVIGTGKGNSNLIRIFSAPGNLEYQFSPYEPSYLGGLNVAAGDVNGDGQAEIVVAPQDNSNLPIRIFNKFGLKLWEFKPYPWLFKGGVSLAVGDVNGDGQADIVTAPGQGGGPQVRVFTAQGKLLRQFMAFDKTFRNGVNLAVGDVDGDGTKDIVTTAQVGGGPHIRVFNRNNQLRSQFFLEPKSFSGGLSVTVLP